MHTRMRRRVESLIQVMLAIPVVVRVDFMPLSFSFKKRFCAHPMKEENDLKYILLSAEAYGSFKMKC